MEGAANRPLDKQQGDASSPTQGSSNANPEVQDISSPGNPEGGLTSDVGVKAASKASKDNTLPKGQGAGKAVNYEDMEDTSSVVNQPNSAGVREEYETQDEEEYEEVEEYATEEGLFEEDLRALFADDENLTEEFKTKAAEIFEAVVSSRVISEVKAIEVELTEQANAAYAERVEELVENIDKYLNYVTENWMEENEMAIENGLRNEITESFIKGLQQVFTEHYIEVPEDKYDVLAEMQEKLDALEFNLNEEIQKNINLNEEAVYLKKQNIFSVVSEDLADTEAEKFATLVEDITYTSDESYNNKLKVVKENYFRKTSVNTSADNALEDTVNELVSQDNSIMGKYAKAISKHSKF